jgi:hypothetical protein
LISHLKLAVYAAGANPPNRRFQVSGIDWRAGPGRKRLTLAIPSQPVKKSDEAFVAQEAIVPATT